MTAPRLRGILALLGWSQRQLARLLGVGETTVRDRWARLDDTVPPNVAAWLERIVAPLEAQPLPDGWTVERRPPGRPKLAA